MGLQEDCSKTMTEQVEMVHIKGFSFRQRNRAFELNFAAECDRIYGDTFEMKETSVEGIGNNVSLEFEQMDFTDDVGATRLIVFGRSPIDKNTMHIRFANHDGESNQLVDFALPSCFFFYCLFT